MKSKFIVNEPYTICLFHDRKLGKKFRGIAKCSQEDTFDPEKGMQIAQLKAEINRDKYRLNRAQSDVNYIERKAFQLVDNLYKRMDIYDDRINERQMKIVELTT